VIDLLAVWMLSVEKELTALSIDDINEAIVLADYYAYVWNC
jgi:hypothetical protein